MKEIILRIKQMNKKIIYNKHNKNQIKSKNKIKNVKSKYILKRGKFLERKENYA